jgi:hypothetical protein
MRIRKGHADMRIFEETPLFQLLVAIRQFNDRKWYDCHKTLGNILLEEKDGLRDFLQGFLLIAVALHHMHIDNFGGAVSLLTTGLNCLHSASGTCQWINSTQFIIDADRLRLTLEQLGSEQMKLLNPALIPRIMPTSPVLA